MTYDTLYPIPSTHKKIVVAMSGGVDSSVTAALLKEEGHEVIGVTMQVWPHTSEDKRFDGCCSLDSIEDARKVANKLDIPYYVLNFRDVFKEKVIQNFINEYEKGRTPNPCIRCNQYIKFEYLLQKTIGLGAAYLATGHYARIIFDENKSRYLLKKGKDKEKDQSYFLYTMTQEQLAKTIMPLGNLTKPKTRELAVKFGLRTASKPESQEICFVPDNDYRSFYLRERGKEVKEGPIYDIEGNILGKHKGVAFYTVGQRKGLGIAAPKPLYVTELNYKDNSIKVGPIENLYKRGLIAKDFKLISKKNFDEQKKISVKIRYNMDGISASIRKEKGALTVMFDEAQKAITPGQAVVFYDEDTVIGGATIEKAI